MSERTFEPTPARRQQAFDAGRFPRSVDLSGLLVFITAMILMIGYGDQVLAGFRELLVSQLQHLTTDQHQIWDISRREGSQFALRFGLPAVGALFVVALLSCVGQGGWAWSPQRTVPDLSRLGPRAAGSRSALCVGLLAKFGVVVAALIYLVRVRWMSLFASSEATRFFDLSETIKAFSVSALQLALAVGVAVSLDYVWSLWRYQQSLKMTAEEMREESRDRTGGLSVPQAAAVATRDDA